MAGVEVETIVTNTEEKTITEPTIETPKEAVHSDHDSAPTDIEVEIKEEEVPQVEKKVEKTETAPSKEQTPDEIPAVAEEKDGKPEVEASAEAEKPVDIKA